MHRVQRIQRIQQTHLVGCVGDQVTGLGLAGPVTVPDGIGVGGHSCRQKPEPVHLLTVRTVACDGVSRAQGEWTIGDDRRRAHAPKIQTRRPLTL